MVLSLKKSQPMQADNDADLQSSEAFSTVDVEVLFGVNADLDHIFNDLDADQNGQVCENCFISRQQSTRLSDLNVMVLI